MPPQAGWLANEGVVDATNDQLQQSLSAMQICFRAFLHATQQAGKLQPCSGVACCTNTYLSHDIDVQGKLKFLMAQDGTQTELSSGAKGTDSVLSKAADIYGHSGLVTPQPFH